MLDPIPACDNKEIFVYLFKIYLHKINGLITPGYLHSYVLLYHILILIRIWRKLKFIKAKLGINLNKKRYG